MLVALMEESREPVQSSTATAGDSIPNKLGEPAPVNVCQYDGVPVEMAAQPIFTNTHAHGVGTSSEDGNGRVRRKVGPRPEPPPPGGAHSDASETKHENVRRLDDVSVKVAAQPIFTDTHVHSVGTSSEDGDGRAIACL